MRIVNDHHAVPTSLSVINVSKTNKQTITRSDYFMSVSLS